MKKYDVSITVTGNYAATVMAETKAEAIEKANEMCEGADFGDLTNIDWKDGEVTGVWRIHKEEAETCS